MPRGGARAARPGDPRGVLELAAGRRRALVAAVREQGGAAQPAAVRVPAGTSTTAELLASARLPLGAARRRSRGRARCRSTPSSATTAATPTWTRCRRPDRTAVLDTLRADLLAEFPGGHARPAVRHAVLGGPAMSAATARRRARARPADGGADRRQAILDAAREQFSEKGYDGASVRASPATPTWTRRWCTTTSAARSRSSSRRCSCRSTRPTCCRRCSTGDPDGLGERLARFFLGMWADPAFRTPMLGLIRSAFTSEQGATLLREFVGSALLGRVAQAVGVGRPAARRGRCRPSSSGW